MSEFRKLLIANRGEIACRVIATARSMGLRTVAVYSDADAGALHVEMADAAVRIGPPPVSESYLDAEAILAAAQATGAEAIHPGYGFLSENPEFAEKVAEAGLIFVGPPADAIRKMGLKDAAKSLMSQSGVPVVPGYHGAEQNVDFLTSEAGKIGFPVLIKARAGGGGKGMRLVESASDFGDALAAAQREGQASFGDAGVLVEKFIETPRHIEIQVMADGHGNVVHLFERDCSLQRRHQKVIEEAPAPGMTADVRAAMGKAACDAARAIGYVGAGTVEFIADGRGALRPDGFWFMEMNTRLQVEHPVTEAITGLDLVALQLQVASGAALPFGQDDLTIDGHAFEARLYAEDAAAGFLPATGTLTHLAFPDGAAFERGDVRIDAGVRAGDAITPYYDPMIAKVITHGRDRAEALARLHRALSATEVAGTFTNLGFLARLADHEQVRKGALDTGLIECEQAVLTATDADASDLAFHVAVLIALDVPRRVETGDPWVDLAGWQAWDDSTCTIRLGIDAETRETAVTVRKDGLFEIDGVNLRAAWGERGLRVTAKEFTQEVPVHSDAAAITVFIDGETFAFQRIDPLAQASADHEGGDHVLAPMPGLVTRVDVSAGDAVAKGDTLLILEAMKMEHTLSAPRNGMVAEVLASSGAQVASGALMVRLEGDHDD
ncbi:MAG: acetyl/propionyl/methylcrotonyl-CoA carboxylase subunit alpha [Paracoccaceae bacterium]|nr:acetyl/propionyl/methylcrotonyl-CoA carboxylase subunit alpha [Paracoccaceae bacterium]